MNRIRSELRRLRWPSLIGWSALLFYVGWNLYWIVQGQIAPSLFRAVTGLPAPTTGGTRAMKLLARGEFAESLRANALAIPLTTLFLLTITAVVFSKLYGRGGLIAKSWFQAWVVLLFIAWVCKLLGPRQYW